MEKVVQFWHILWPQFIILVYISSDSLGFVFVEPGRWKTEVRLIVVISVHAVSHLRLGSQDPDIILMRLNKGEICSYFYC